jgi:drug/metabolite transporter (DMT)-like permease
MAIPIALASALCYGFAMVLQQHSAARVDPSMSMRPGLVTTLATSWIWLAGIALNVVGFGLRFLALGRGALVVVQVCLASSLLFALPVAARWNRERLANREWTGAAAITLGLALFVIAADSGDAHVHESASAWWLTGLTVGALSAILVVMARGRAPRVRAALLAAAGGALLALTVAITKVAAETARADLWHVFGSWSIYALVVVVPVGVLVVQSAFGVAPLSASLPVLMVVELLVGVLLGVTLFDERLAGGPPAHAGQAAGLVAMTVGIVLLARSSIVTGETPDSEAAGRDGYRPAP